MEIEKIKGKKVLLEIDNTCKHRVMFVDFKAISKEDFIHMIGDERLKVEIEDMMSDN